MTVHRIGKYSGLVILVLWLAVGLAACAPTSSPPQDPAIGCPMAANPSYGHQPTSPILVGGKSMLQGPLREQEYLNQLHGPDGQPIEYSRRGSFEQDGVHIDIYHVTYDGLEEPIVLYLDMYTAGPCRIPHGFTAVQSRFRPPIAELDHTGPRLQKSAPS